MSDIDYIEPTAEERVATLQNVAAMGVSPGGALNHLTDDVRLFHTLFGHPAPRKPQMQSPELVARRAKWIEGEVTELRDATTIYGQADAYLDIIYFAVGGLVELGIKFTHRLWRLVQTANLAKVWPDGTVRKDERGKVQKPDGWIAPDAAIATAIDEEAGAVAVPETVHEAVINMVGDEVVQRLTAAWGGHANIILFGVREDGWVASTSNMDLNSQRDFLRFVNQSFNSGDVTLVSEPPSEETKQ